MYYSHVKIIQDNVKLKINIIMWHNIKGNGERLSLKKTKSPAILMCQRDYVYHWLQQGNYTVKYQSSKMHTKRALF